jgi:hypothetical protein
MSSVLPSALDRCRQLESLSHLHSHILCVGAVNTPNLVPAFRLGHSAKIAPLHIWKSEAVGCSVGHRRCDLFQCAFGWPRTSESILLPDAVNISETNNACQYTRTQFSRRRISREYPFSMNTCMRKRSPSHGLSSPPSEMIVRMPNMDIFSQSIFIHECVERKLYFLQDSCRGCVDIPNSSRKSKWLARINRPIAESHL